MARRAKRGPMKLLLAETLDLRAVTPLYGELQACRGRDIDLDASGVRRIGGQCLQLLIAARISWEADGLKFRIEAPSDDFVEGASLLGAPTLAATPDL